jgi:hypothetical protein
MARREPTIEAIERILDSRVRTANLLQDVSSPDPGLGTATVRRR